MPHKEHTLAAHGGLRRTLCLAGTVLLLSNAALTAAADDEVRDQFNPVRTAVTSLSIAPDARAGGMGDVGAATDPDVHSQYWNPAKYPFTISRAGFAINYTPWLRKLTTGIALLNAEVAVFGQERNECTKISRVRPRPLQPPQTSNKV